MPRPRTASADLPDWMVRKRRRSGVYFYLQIRDQWGRLSLIPLGTDEGTAIATGQAKMAELETPQLTNVLGARARKSVPWLAAEMHRKCAANARRRGIAYQLSAEDVQKVFDRSGGKCELTKIPFELGKSAEGHRVNPWAPSIDRLNSAEPYRPGNFDWYARQSITR